jgi:GT2 family glycosyltransferase
MTVSILIHNRNRARALRRCLRSISGQRHRPLEVVILDAGSTDDSPAVLSEGCSELQRLGIDARWIACTQMGVAASRNRAASLARGDLLCFVDNDAEFADPDALAASIRPFITEPRLAVVSFRVLAGDSGDLDPFAWVFRRRRRTWSERPFETFTFAGTGFCTRATAFRQAGGFWDHLGYSREEEELGLALVDQGWTLRYEPGTVIRHHADPSGRSSLWDRRHTELRNGLLVLWRRFPIVAAVPLGAARIASMCVRDLVRERQLPWHLLGSVTEAVREWRTSGLQRRPIRLASMCRYALLHLF